jgi:hypothetical protein
MYPKADVSSPLREPKDWGRAAIRGLYRRAGIKTRLECTGKSTVCVICREVGNLSDPRVRSNRPVQAFRTDSILVQDN